jgi:hypothetical protein
MAIIQNQSENSSSSKANEKRYSNRHAFKMPIAFDDSFSYETGAVRDLSQTGALIETGTPISTGTFVKIIPLVENSSAPFELNGRVVRVTEDILEDMASASRFHVAVEFYIKSNERNLLSNMIDPAGNA